MYEKGCWRRVSVGRRADGRSPRATRRHDAPSRARASTMTDDTRARLLADARDATRDADRATARRRAARRRAETSLTTFVLEAFARASPIALGVVAARLTSDVLDAFVDAFVSPSVALMLGSTSRDLEAMSFSRARRGVSIRRARGANRRRVSDARADLPRDARRGEVSNRGRAGVDAERAVRAVQILGARGRARVRVVRRSPSDGGRRRRRRRRRFVSAARDDALFRRARGAVWFGLVSFSVTTRRALERASFASFASFASSASRRPVADVRLARA